MLQQENKTIVINKIENYKGYVIVKDERNNKFYLTRICTKCNNLTTAISKDGYEKWYKYEDGLICQLCYKKIMYHFNKR